MGNLGGRVIDGVEFPTEQMPPWLFSGRRWVPSDSASLFELHDVVRAALTIGKFHCEFLPCGGDALTFRRNCQVVVPVPFRLARWIGELENLGGRGVNSSGGFHNALFSHDSSVTIAVCIDQLRC